MIIRFGYVALSKTINETSSHTLTYTKYKEEISNDKLFKVVQKNLDGLEEILKYNIRNNIHFYRMSSAIFPLATHPKVNFDVLNIFKERLIKIGNIIMENKIRVDIHLDQFCVLNSVSKEVVTSTINIINFYKNMFITMNIRSKMIIHIGSSVGGKEEGINRFIENFKLLDKETQKMIIIENDDKIYNIDDTLYLSKKINVPVVLDYHHHKCNSVSEINIREVFNTWDIIPKIHFSSPKNKKDFRPHNDYINVDDFIEFLGLVENIDIDFDVMIEAKEKDNALFKLVRELKYKNYYFIDDTTLKIDNGIDNSRKK